MNHICPADHPHATAGTCYHQHRCRCTPCRTTEADTQTRRRKLLAYGRWAPFVDATVTRNHVRVCSAAGIGHRRLAELSGVTLSHIRAIAAGRTRRVRPHTAASIRRITPDDRSYAAGARVLSRGVQRRLQALYAVGWSPSAVGVHMGMAGVNVSRVLRCDQVTVRTRDRYTAVYDRLWCVPPTNSPASQERMRTRALLEGWVPPLGWDDIDTDETPADAVDLVVIDDVAVDLATRGHQVTLTVEERHVAVRQLHAAGYHDSDIARMLRVSVRTIERDRAHLELPGLLRLAS